MEILYDAPSLMDNVNKTVFRIDDETNELTNLIDQANYKKNELDTYEQDLC